MTHDPLPTFLTSFTPIWPLSLHKEHHVSSYINSQLFYSVISSGICILLLMLIHPPILLISFPPTGLQVTLVMVSKISSYLWICFLNQKEKRKKQQTEKKNKSLQFCIPLQLCFYFSLLAQLYNTQQHAAVTSNSLPAIFILKILFRLVLFSPVSEISFCECG